MTTLIQADLFSALPHSASESQIAAHITMVQSLRSAAPPLPTLPARWTLETYEGYQGREFTRAVDPDGCRWYDADGEWRLNVPWFRRSHGLPDDAPDDVAVVDTVRGNEPFPIDESGTIRIGRRRILGRQWDH